MKKFIYLISFSLLFIACQNENTSVTPIVDNSAIDTSSVSEEIPLKQAAVIDKPFDKIDIPFKTYNYNNRKGSTINLGSGTQIKVPKNAFNDKNGNPVEKNIQIKYRELHNITDIMLSGIKMNTPEGDFESAGMFEIRALSGNQELELRKDKSIKVEMASYKGGDFNSYVLNENSKEWEFIEKSDPEPNPRKQEKLDEITKQQDQLVEVCKEEPREYQEGDAIFDLDYSLNRHYSMDFFNGAMWTIIGDQDEVDAFKRDKKAYNEMELLPIDSLCNTFELTLWNRSNVVVDKNKTKYHVQPVWKGAEYKRAKKNYKESIAKYKKMAKELAAKRRAAEREADLIRKFELKGMGIYNCDRVLDWLKAVPAALVLTCKEKIKTWWYITFNKKVAVKYYNPTVPDFKYNPNSTNSIIAILPNDKVGLVTEEQFQAAYDKFRNNPDPDKKMEIELQLEPEAVADKKAFQEHISRF